MKCPICKNEISEYYDLKHYTYRIYQNYYCSWSCYREALKRREKKHQENKFKFRVYNDKIEKKFTSIFNVMCFTNVCENSIRIALKNDGKIKNKKGEIYFVEKIKEKEKEIEK